MRPKTTANYEVTANHCVVNHADGIKTYQLIFELPQHAISEALSQWIHDRPPPSMHDRLMLILCIARAVQSVHNLGLVHKSIRPRAMLVLLNPQNPSQRPKIYLQDWTHVRDLESGITARLGEVSWLKAIYQHPERQGKYVDKTYEPRHDIYSLGVSALEVLLWKPFVVHTSGADSQLRVCDLFESTGLARGVQDGGFPERYRGDTSRLTGHPWTTKSIWCDIARSKLGDHEQEQLILGCLEGRFNSMAEVLNYMEQLMKSQAG